MPFEWVMVAQGDHPRGDAAEESEKGIFIRL